MAQSVCGLEAERRWVLSGTPIVSKHSSIELDVNLTSANLQINSPRDLGSILTFLRICSPLDNEVRY